MVWWIFAGRSLEDRTSGRLPKSTGERPLHNFGKNVLYDPQHRYAPRTEEEVLNILSRHGGGQIRVQGSGHSWSGIVEAGDVLLDLASFSNVAVGKGPIGHVVRVGAGATLDKLLSALRATAFDLPTLGAITRQTIAGATATATHGTGNASLSSLVQAVKLACYDAKGDPFVKTISGGDELLAARTSLGCLGVILELTLEVEPRFWMEEQMRVHDSLESVLAEEAAWPQQQFLLFPYGWRWYAYHRRRITEPNARALRRLRWFQAYDVLVVEWGLHALIKTVRLFGAGARRRVLETCAAAADALNAGQRPQRGDIHAAHAPPLPFPPCRNGVVRADIPFERRREGSPGGDSILRRLE